MGRFEPIILRIFFFNFHHLSIALCIPPSFYCSLPSIHSGNILFLQRLPLQSHRDQLAEIKNAEHKSFSPRQKLFWLEQLVITYLLTLRHSPLCFRNISYVFLSGNETRPQSTINRNPQIKYQAK